MTEKELMRAAKTFRANCLADGEKMSFEESCKIVLLSGMHDQYASIYGMDTLESVAVVYDFLKSWNRPRWKFW